MKIVKTESIEDCFKETLFIDAETDRPITRDFIRFLGTKGELQYYEDFPRPFFKLTVPSRYSLKGIEGSHSIRVLLNDENSKGFEEFKELISSYPAGETDDKY
ncbi:MAG: hypothetical protein HPY53_11935 [Brevinematales bacterium]|nr:hypothetical protein [Brevinematales bacterium]